MEKSNRREKSLKMKATKRKYIKIEQNSKCEGKISWWREDGIKKKKIH